MTYTAEEISLIQQLINTLPDGEKRLSSVGYEYSNSWLPLKPDKGYNIFNSGNLKRRNLE